MRPGLGIGLIGCGRFGRHLARNVGAIDGARIVAVADRSPIDARTLARELGVPPYGSYQDLIADPRVDAVIVAIPHSAHEEVTVAAARAGKHIFCEKPMAIDVAACYRMLDAAERSRVKLMVGQVVRLYPLFRRVAAIVEAGTLGTLAAFSFSGLYNIQRVNWWARSETMGALLHSPGVHDLDFLRVIGGDARAVFAVESCLRIQSGVDYADSVFLVIEFASGAIGSLQSSVSNLVPCRRGNLLGTAGSLAFDAQARVIDYATFDGERAHLDLTDADDDEGVRAELQSFVDWIDHDAPPLVTGADGLRAVELIDAAYRSIRERRPIALPLSRETARG